MKFFDRVPAGADGAEAVPPTSNHREGLASARADSIVPAGCSGRPPGAIKEAAVEWISRRDAGLSENEEAEFQTWLAADRRHAAAIEALQPAWSAINRLRRAGRGIDLRRQVEGIVARRTRRRHAFGIASLAAAAAITFAFVLSRSGSYSDHPASTIAVRPDRQLLPDGSTIDLNFGAEVAVGFTAEKRGVRLVSGEALFNAAKDDARPFVVTAAGVTVRAVGTAFTVRLDPKAVDVLVTEGRVAVGRTTDDGGQGFRGMETRSKQAGDLTPSFPHSLTPSLPHSPTPPLPHSLTPIYVDAGKRVVVPIEATSIQSLAPQSVMPGEVAKALAWRNRRVEFNGTSLAEAVEIFNRDNSIHLSVANPETGALQITGVFWTTDPEAFSRVLETSLGLTATRVNGRDIALRK